MRAVEEVVPFFVHEPDVLDQLRSRGRRAEHLEPAADELVHRVAVHGGESGVDCKQPVVRIADERHAPARMLEEAGAVDLGRGLCSRRALRGLLRAHRRQDELLVGVLLLAHHRRVGRSPEARLG